MLSQNVDFELFFPPIKKVRLVESSHTNQDIIRKMFIIKLYLLDRKLFTTVVLVYSVSKKEHG